jgi:hypothetical protein
MIGKYNECQGWSIGCWGRGSMYNPDSSSDPTSNQAIAKSKKETQRQKETQKQFNEEKKGLHVYKKSQDGIIKAE